MTTKQIVLMAMTSLDTDELFVPLLSQASTAETGNQAARPLRALMADADDALA